MDEIMNAVNRLVTATNAVQHAGPGEREAAILIAQEQHEAVRLAAETALAAESQRRDAAWLAQCAPTISAEEVARKMGFTNPRGDLDARMQAAGMIPLTELLAKIPLASFITHTGVKDLATFEAWLKMRREEMLRMQVSMEMGDCEQGDLYEWVIAHVAVFTEAQCNFQAAVAGQAAA